MIGLLTHKNLYLTQLFNNCFNVALLSNNPFFISCKHVNLKLFLYCSLTSANVPKNIFSYLATTLVQILLYKCLKNYISIPIKCPCVIFVVLCVKGLTYTKAFIYKGFRVFVLIVLDVLRD